MGKPIVAVCDACKLKEHFGERPIQGWPSAAVEFLQEHAGHNFTGCRVVEADNPCPNRVRSYAEVEHS